MEEQQSIARSLWITHNIPDAATQGKIFFYCVAERAVKPCRSSRSNTRGGMIKSHDTCKTGTRKRGRGKREKEEGERKQKSKGKKEKGKE